MDGSLPDRARGRVDRYRVEEVTDPLQLTVIYEQGDDGWVIARIREVPGAMSQGRTQKEARENVLDALRELVLSYLDEGGSAPLQPGANVEAVRVTLAS